jgi:WXG100 family type VII secretion target
MAGYTTGADELLKAGQQMEDANNQLQSNLAKLAGECEQMESSWSGQAATAFQNLMGRFQTDAKNLNTSLQSISEAIAGNANAYRQQEQEASESVSRIASALGG